MGFPLGVNPRRNDANGLPLQVGHVAIMVEDHVHRLARRVLAHNPRIVQDRGLIRRLGPEQVERTSFRLVAAMRSEAGAATAGTAAAGTALAATNVEERAPQVAAVGRATQAPPRAGVPTKATMMEVRKG